jgi:hypothetical protein
MTSSDPNEAMRELAREVMRELVQGVLGDAPAPQRVNGRAHHADQAQNSASGDVQVTRESRDAAAIVPQVPAPPVAAVLRPSTWSGPASPGEVIGDHAPAAGEVIGDRAPAAGEVIGDRAPAAGEVIGNRAPAAGEVIGDRTPPVRVEAVTIDTTEDLERFARELVSRVANPRDLVAIRTGRLRFALRRGAAPAAATANHPGQSEVAPVRVVKGAITERAVRDAAADGARLVLARGAVLTPLARDRASALGVEIERERKC